MKTLQDLPSSTLSGHRVLMRLDLNVPSKDGKVLDDTRIRSSLPSIQYCLQQGAQVIIMSHCGRPQAGKSAEQQPEFSLANIVAELEKHLGQEVAFAATLDALSTRADAHSCILVENTRFLPGEKENDEKLSQRLAALCDVFVMDAFGSAHRAHASTVGVATYAKLSCAGLLLSQEIEALNKVLHNPQRPLLAIVGGAKVGDKLKLLEKLSSLADVLIVGGGIANTFLAASGKPVGKSLYEADLQDMARKIMQQVQVLLPVDVVTATGLDSPAGNLYAVDDLGDDLGDDLDGTANIAEQMILDAGPKSLTNYAKAVATAKTILWNGPLGVFEQQPFAAGTQSLVKAISNSAGYSVAGGGETIAAINQFAGRVDYISTGGGAFLEYVEQGSLPAIQALS